MTFAGGIGGRRKARDRPEMVLQAPPPHTHMHEIRTWLEDYLLGVGSEQECRAEEFAL